MDLLKFVILDEEDLEVVSTHLQDAVVRVSDVLWQPADKRLVVALNRFDWESAQNPGDEAPDYRRRRAVLRFERVMSCQGRAIERTGGDSILNLLAVEFAETDAPGGTVTLTFSGGGAMRLAVECLEGELADLGPSWTAARCPAHPDTAELSPGRRNRA